MKFLEERTTRVSLIVVLRDATAQTGPITSGVQLSLRNQPARPVLHRLGYWLFLNLSQTTQTLVWIGVILQSPSPIIATQIIATQ